jgi:hypothetical protein
VNTKGEQIRNTPVGVLRIFESEGIWQRMKYFKNANPKNIGFRTGVIRRGNLAFDYSQTLKQLLLLALSLLASVSLQAGIFNTNLIVNGNAEAGAGSISGNDILPVPGWITTNGFTVGAYGVSSGVPTNCPGPGTNYFAGGPGTALSSAYQFISLTNAAAQVDTGGVLADLTGYLGGWSSQDDNGILKAEFTDGVKTNILGSLTLGPVMAIDRTNQTVFLYRENISLVPTGARLVKLTLTMTRSAGSYDDGYADNLSLVLTTNQPALTIHGGANLMVTWPTNYADGYLLQQSTNLASTNWLACTNAISNVSGTNQTTIPPAIGKQFFRLYHP